MAFEGYMFRRGVLKRLLVFTCESPPDKELKLFLGTGHRAD